MKKLLICSLLLILGLTITLFWKNANAISANGEKNSSVANKPVNGEFPASKKNVAIFVHQGVELLDFAGPGEVFAAAGHGQGFNVYTVAATAESISSQGFVTITPQYTIENCPKPDIIILPGGRTGIPLADEKVIAWIKESAPKTEVMLSVCTGAFLLAKAGLLDGREATTHWGSIAKLKEVATKTKVLENRRFVDNGKIVTAAGVSAGIDGALHVVKRLLGPAEAEATAKYMEYNWTNPVYN